MTLRRRILESLAERGKTRGQLVLELESRRTTVYDYLRDFETEGLVERYNVHDLSTGRPYTGWKLTKKGQEALTKNG